MGLQVGCGPGGNGSYLLSGSGRLSAPQEVVGSLGPGSFVQTGGTNSAAIVVSNNGSYIMTAGLLQNSGAGATLVVDNLFQQSGGNATVSANGFLALSNSAAYNLSGTAQLSAKSELIGLGGSGVFTQSGGTNSVTGGSYGFVGLILGYGAGDSGTYNLNGGLLKVYALSAGAGAAAFNLGGGTLGGVSAWSSSLAMTLTGSSGNATIDTTGGNIGLAGVVSGSGGLVKVGSGTLILSAANTYVGPTTVAAGRLEVDGSLASPITVTGGGVLCGAGSLASVVVGTGGFLCPDNSLRIMSLTGSLDLLPGAIMDYDLDLPSASDKVLMPLGQLVLSGQKFGDFNFTPSANFGTGCYDLIVADSISGSLGASTSGMIDGYPATLAVQNNTTLVLDVTPEPSTLALLPPRQSGLCPTPCCGGDDGDAQRVRPQTPSHPAKTSPPSCPSPAGRRQRNVGQRDLG